MVAYCENYNKICRFLRINLVTYLIEYSKLTIDFLYILNMNMVKYARLRKKK